MRRAPLPSPALQHYFRTGELGHPDPTHHGFGDGVLEVLHLTHDSQRAALTERWHAIRDEMLADWITQSPGTRPHVWWLLEAPPEPRHRLGGLGTPCHEVLAHARSERFGIPTEWVDPWAEAYYNGRARDVHGQPIGTEYRPGSFRGRAIDPDNPPRFESQAAYLDRCGLLSAAERLNLPPDAFEPERVRPPVEDTLDDDAITPTPGGPSAA